MQKNKKAGHARPALTMEFASKLILLPWDGPGIEKV